MDDYISREAALNFEMEIEADPDEIQAITKGMALYADYIKSIPAVDVVERKWIPVTERLPENSKRVLAVHELVERYPWIEILRYGIPDNGISAKELCFYYTGTNIDVPISRVTHWMPLPEPPESEV